MKKTFTLILMMASSIIYAQHNVTFKVDMNQYSGSTANGVFVNGNFTTNGGAWCGTCNPMTDANNDGIWETTIAISNAAIDYKFTVNGWNAQENFAGGESCTRTDGGFTNRHIASITTAVVLDTVCYNSCTACTANAPSAGAPAPTANADDVISLFSDSYTDITVNTWRTVWSKAAFSGVKIAEDSMHLYDNLDFVGIETVGDNSIDITSMQHFNMDVWSPNATTFRIKLIDWGADNAFGGGDDTEHEVVFENPTLGAWINYNISIDSFKNLSGKKNISQLIFSAKPVGSAKIYVDNIFFSKEAVEVVPMAAAADPTAKQEDVISLFSGVYEDVDVNSWRTVWSNATLEDVAIDGNDVKKYTSLDFVGIETTGDNSIDASAMEHIHFDAWTPNATTYRIKVVDFGADNAFGGGDDTEHEVIFEMPANEEWTNHKIALSDMTGLKAKANISQIILSALPTGNATLYIDNLYFSKPEANSVKENLFGSLDIYPNPAKDKVTVNIHAKSTTIRTVSLINIQGVVINTITVNAPSVNQNIDLTDLSSGVYYLRINTAKGNYTQKLLVN